ncbi:MAG: M48 family metalloprotease, partial [Bdellovibrionales bacterium]
MNKICKSASRKSLSVVIADTNDIQAMSYVETGTVYISRGILYAIQNEAELVALLSHEVCHFQLKHGLDDVQNQNETEALGQISSIFEDVEGISVSGETKNYLEKIRQAQFSQKNETAADEFAIVLANRLGYNVGAFANLFDRISQLDSKNIFEKINSVSGTHLPVSNRAQHARDFIKSKNIASFQKFETEKYLKAVLGIAKFETATSNVAKSESVKKAESELEILNQKIAKLHQEKRTLPVKEFLKYMSELRRAAIDLKILDQIQSQITFSETDKPEDVAPLDADEFMMELIRLEKPLWISDANVIKLKETLATLGQMGVRFLPVVGDAIDLYELLLGKNYFTGEVLSFGERAATALGVIAGNGVNWRTAVDGLGGFKNIRGISAIDPHKISEAVTVAKEAIEDAPILGRPAKTLTEEIT